jgi:hypothetical protein
VGERGTILREEGVDPRTPKSAPDDDEIMKKIQEL